MATYERDDVTAVLRTALHGRLPKPTGEFRRRSWRAFEAALERHLDRSKRARLKSGQPPS